MQSVGATGIASWETCIYREGRYVKRIWLECPISRANETRCKLRLRRALWAQIEMAGHEKLAMYSSLFEKSWRSCILKWPMKWEEDPKIVYDFIPLSHFENADQLKIIFLVIHWSFPNTLAPTFLKQTQVECSSGTPICSIEYLSNRASTSAATGGHGQWPVASGQWPVGMGRVGNALALCTPQNHSV